MLHLLLVNLMRGHILQWPLWMRSLLMHKLLLWLHLWRHVLRWYLLGWHLMR